MGEPDILESFSTDKVKSFVDRYYIPSNIVFFSMGKTDFRRIVYYAEKYLSDINRLQDLRKREIPLAISSEYKVISKETSQVHALIGGRSYTLQNPKRKALHLLNNILGGPGMNSRLNLELREKRGYVYNVESSATAYTDTGLFSIYFGSDKRNADKCVSLIYKELDKLKNKQLTYTQLAAAKKQLIGQIGVSGDNNESLSLSLGKTFFHYNHINSLAETFNKINAITSEQLMDVANEIFDESNLFKLIYQ